MVTTVKRLREKPVKITVNMMTTVNGYGEKP